MPEILPLSTVDYPGLPSCVLFFHGCPFRCPFCHNPRLLEPEENVDIDLVFKKVRECHGLASAVVFSGGEPLMSADAVGKIASGIRKEFGEVKMKLDTNGFYPRELHTLLKGGLLDFVAIDFKGSPEQYETGAIIGNEKLGPPAIQNLRRSMELCARTSVEIEIRTTVVPGMNDSAETIAAIAREVPPKAAYVLQQFSGSGGILDPALEKVGTVGREKLLTLGKVAKEAFAGTVKMRTLEGGEEPLA